MSRTTRHRRRWRIVLTCVLASAISVSVLLVIQALADDQPPPTPTTTTTTTVSPVSPTSVVPLAANLVEDKWLFLGDSITIGALAESNDLTSRVQAADPSRNPIVVNHAVGGSTVLSTLNGTSANNTTLASELAATDAQFVVLAFGTNDFPATFAMETAVQQIIAAGRIPVVPRTYWAWSSTPTTPGTMLPNIQAINAQIDALYVTYPQIQPGPDMYSVFEDRLEFFQAIDDPHLNAAGNNQWRTSWATHMTTVDTTTTTTAPPTTSTTPRESPDDIPSNFDVDRFLDTGFGIPESYASYPGGNFRMICDFSHLAYDDPIVYPGQPGRAHLHMFFGNTLANANSTYESLRTTGDGTCQGGPINRSGYWAPAVLNANDQVVVPDFISVYYKGISRNASDITNMVPIPEGLKMIAGYNMATGSSDTHFDWFCETNQIKQQTIPNCAPGERVGVVLAFPYCWDGTNLDSSDHRSHLAYDTNQVCPTTHPVRIPEYTIGVWFTHDGNSQNWHISSDRMNGMTHANGSTFHADWMGAWDPDIQDRWMTNCINGLRNCAGGQLGDGTHMTERTPYTGPKILPQP